MTRPAPGAPRAGKCEASSPSLLPLCLAISLTFWGRGWLGSKERRGLHERGSPRGDWGQDNVRQLLPSYGHGKRYRERGA